MILAMVFDLDGTLVKTERLKAISYARAVTELCPYTVTDAEVINFFKEVVGLSRQEVAEALIEKFDLDERLKACMTNIKTSSQWQAFIQIRLRYYEEMLADPDVLRNNQWAHNMDLLYTARQNNCATALATMSHCEQVQRVLSILEMEDQFDFVATRDDVEHGKPDPEIYLLVANAIGVEPEHILVIEDSVTGETAAKAAGMNVIAVATPFTKDGLHKSGLLDDKWIIDDPANLLDAVRHYTDRV